MKDKRITRHKRVRKNVKGSETRPRLSVYRSNKYIYAQIIDDIQGKTLAFSTSLSLKRSQKAKNQVSNIEIATSVGETLAKLALKKNIKKVVFDRGGYKYHGKVKAIAEGARKEGLIF